MQASQCLIAHHAHAIRPSSTERVRCNRVGRAPAGGIRASNRMHGMPPPAAPAHPTGCARCCQPSTDKQPCRWGAPDPPQPGGSHHTPAQPSFATGLCPGVSVPVPALRRERGRLPGRQDPPQPCGLSLRRNTALEAKPPSSTSQPMDLVPSGRLAAVPPGPRLSDAVRAASSQASRCPP